MSAAPDPLDALIADLETELSDFWRRSRIRARAQAGKIDANLDPSCYPLLMAVARRGPIPMSDLVARLGVDKSTVTRQVDAIERLGLVHKRPAPDDARARVVELTAEGRARISAVAETERPRWRDELAQWEPADIRRLVELMHRLGPSISADPE